jgi:tetratricopeptide (TPR) repeat protein
MTLQPCYRKGDRIGGRYLVHQALMGGMGEVYLCLDLEENHPYALKTFQQRYLTNSRVRQLFAHEVGAWVALEKHPNIVRCFYMDMLDHQPFMILEWIAAEEGRGIELRNWLRRGSLDLRTALDFIIDICHGLIHAQAKQPGLVHRDLKPENILVAQGRLAKITDFGLASLVQRARLDLIANQDTVHETQTIVGASGLVGTPPYMAPEQWRGEPGDVRTDVYAVGCILYELLTGRLPYWATTLDIVRRQHEQDSLPVLPPDCGLPLTLNAILGGCLAKRPEARFATFDALREEVATLYRREFGVAPRVLPVGESFTAIDYINRGATYHALDRTDDAIADYACAIDRDPTIAILYTNRGNVYATLGRFNEALADYERALTIDPTYATVYGARGLTYAKMGCHMEALADYTQAIELDPTDARVFYSRGNTYATLGRHVEACADFTRAIEFDPTDASAYYNRGNAYDALGRHAEALVDYNYTLTLEPTNVKAQLNRGNTYANLDRVDAALEDFTRTLTLDPTCAMAYYNRGNIYRKLGRLDAALADYERVLSLDPTYAPAHFNRGNTYTDLGCLEEALADYDHAIQLDPTLTPAYLNRGVIYDDLERLEEALADYGHAIQLDSTLASAYLNRAVTYATLSRLPEALLDLEKAAQLGDPTIKHHAADIRQRLGMPPAEGVAPVQHAFEAFLQAGSQNALRQEVAQFSFMTDPQFIAAVEHAIIEEVPPNHRPAFEQRLSWLRAIAREQR